MIFSPNLLRAEKEELSQIMMEAGYLTSVVKLMIEEIDYMTNVHLHTSTNWNRVDLRVQQKTDKAVTLKMSAQDPVLAKPELVRMK